MLEKLSIRNFQKNRKLEINLSPTVTVIVGDNGAGKSSLLRALKFLALNEAPKNLVTWGSDQATVLLEVDGHTIGRRRSKKKNLYRLDGAEYKAMGQTVPQPIARVLRLAAVNFQGQMDSPFWFGNTAGQVSKQLNKIINLDVIDRTLADCAGRLRKAKTLVELTQERLEDARRQERAFQGLDDRNRNLWQLERLYEVIQTTAEKRQRLGELIGQLSRLEALEGSGRKRLAEGKGILALGQRIASLGQQRALLGKLINQVEKESQGCTDLATRRKQLEQRLTRVKLCPLCRQPIRSLPYS